MNFNFDKGESHLKEGVDKGELLVYSVASKGSA